MTTKYGGLTVICNGCGKAMRDLGEWPFIWPPTTSETKNFQQASRYACETCRFPDDKYPPGVPFMATIIETGEAA